MMGCCHLPFSLWLVVASCYLAPWWSSDSRLSVDAAAAAAAFGPTTSRTAGSAGICGGPTSTRTMPCRQQQQQQHVAHRRHHHQATAAVVLLSSLQQQQQQQQQQQYDMTNSVVASLKPQVPLNATILSKDPLVYLVPNLLSSDECFSYINRVQRLSSISSNSTGENPHARAMTLSNPPQVSISVQKLWPLPLLCLCAGIPPCVRFLQERGEAAGATVSSSSLLYQLFQVAFPSIGLALVLSATLALVVSPWLIQSLYSNSFSRTSEAMALNLPQDVDFVRPLVHRVCNITAHASWMAWEAPVVTRYRKGASFAPHGDASPSKRGSEWQSEGGQRVVTCICYLNNIINDDDDKDDDGTSDGGGGETYFSKLNVKVQPVEGSALVFFPAHLDTLEADDDTIHESLAPKTGEKWIVQMFGRVGPRVPPPLGLPDSFGEEAL